MLNTFFDKFIFTNALKYKHNNFYLANIPFVIIPSSLLTGLAAREDRELSREIYYCVKESTRTNMERQFRLDFSLEGRQALSLMCDFFTASGWGGINLADLDEEKKRAIVSVSCSPIGEALHGKVRYAVDDFMRGIFAGVFSTFFKADVECVETECIALNARECRFIIKKLDDFDFSTKEARRQLRPR